MEKTENRVIFRTGSRIDFCVLDAPRHLENCLRWLNSPEITKWLLRGFLPISRSQEEDWFAKMAKDKENLSLALETKEGKHIGNCGLHKIDWRDGTAEAGIFIGDTSMWGKGIATEVEGLLLAYAFRDLHLRKINARVFAENIASYKAAVKNGFREEGRLRQEHFRHGKFHDIILLAAFAEEWATRQ